MLEGNLNSRDLYSMPKQESLSNDLERLEAEKRLLLRKADELTQRIAAIERQIRLVKAARATQDERKIKLSQKNANKYIAWEIVRGVLIARKDSGMTTKELYLEAKKQDENLVYSTFRGYLLTYKGKKWIFKKMGQNSWRLTKPRQHEDQEGGGNGIT